MKPILYGLLMVSLLLPVAADAAEDAQLEAARDKISSIFSEIQRENVHASPIDGWYTVRRGAIIAYVSADGRYLLQGDLIDIDNQVNLSEKERDLARLEMMATIDDDHSIVFTPKNVQHRVSIFTDIDCGYCRRLHSQIDQYLEEGIEVRYLLYPRNGPQSPSWTKAEEVWCASDRNNALTLAKQDQEFETQSCDSPTVSDHYALGQDIGLRGTPAIVLEDGRLVSGYLPPDGLLARINQK
ncbi:MAG: DsbC family protein [Woeseia sp.]|nr:DsbC family protein [Woeseia sp.]MBT8097699.1 DsbC family protein [Woeseia sp.]NNE59991.1 DsbC family protein [Woeseia sp.]NNL55566.1 DsbC family protein [Woeseia sp.]